MIPETTPGVLLQAMQRFDLELRDNPEWEGWEHKESHKYAVEHGGRLYPVKKIISMATNTPVSSFSGGDEANEFATRSGFRVIALRESVQAESSLQRLFEQVLEQYLSARSGKTFGGNHPIWQLFVKLKIAVESLPVLQGRRTLRVVPGVGKGNWARVPWLAIIDSKEADAPQGGVYCVFLFREDMTGVYATLNQGVTKPKHDFGATAAREYLHNRATEARALVPELAERSFLLDDNIDLRSEGLGADYEDSTIAYKLYESGHVPPHSDIVLDLEALAAAYSKVLETVNIPPAVKPFDLNYALQELLQSVEAGGLVYEPWQIASYVAAVRTKPFVILAGVTGTGKTKLPITVSRLTGGVSDLIPVRPDWTDSADVLGYVDLQGTFRPGRLLEVAKRAAQNPEQHWTCVVDEMNLARVEQYFAEFLSRIEDRNRDPMGGFVSGPLVGMTLRTDDGQWASVGIPPNLAIVGTVNMDETTHGFSRKVLDRAFTIELSDTDLTRWTLRTENPQVAVWPASAWYPRAISLAGLPALTQAETTRVQTVVDTLTSVNGFLQQAQLQVGYRARDEVALFVLHSLDIASGFLTREGAPVDPLDLAIHMKVLPRLLGGSGAVRRAVLQLLGWARSRKPLGTEEEGQSVLDEWIDLGRPGSLPECQYPRTAARLCIMLERLLSEGYTSYWL